MALPSVILQRGTRGAQPAAAAVAAGTVYCVSDEGNILERSTGAAWTAYSPTTSGTGTVTNTGTLTANALVIGNGSADIKVTTTGTGIVTALGVNVGSAGAPVVQNGALGTPSSGTLTNCTGLPTTGLGTGGVIQVVNTQTGAEAHGTTTIPIDNTIPQITEGDQYMTLAVTPTSATNKLKIEVVINVTNSTNGTSLIVALFQDATANALAAFPVYVTTGGGFAPVTFTHYMTSGTTSATTFRVRAGAQAGTTTFNGSASTAFLGGVIASSITITEIKV